MIEFAGNEKDFNKMVGEGKVLVVFHAQWCGPCRMLAPVLEEIATEQTDLQIVRVDVDANQSLAQNYGVMGVPYLILFQDGAQVTHNSGFMPKEALLEWLAEH